MPHLYQVLHAFFPVNRDWVDGVFFSLSGVVVGLYFILWIRREISRRRYWSRSQLSVVDEFGSDSSVDINEALLRQAEAGVSGTALELRERILVDHEFYDRFSTLRGFSDAYMNGLVDELARRGISARLFFQETAPMGVAAAVIHPQGFFELYVDRSKSEEADLYIRSLFSKN